MGSDHPAVPHDRDAVRVRGAELPEARRGPRPVLGYTALAAAAGPRDAPPPAARAA